MSRALQRRMRVQIRNTEECVNGGKLNFHSGGGTSIEPPPQDRIGFTCLSVDKNDFALLLVIPNLQSCEIATTESESGNHKGVLGSSQFCVEAQFPTPSLFLIDLEVFVTMCTFMPSPKKQKQTNKKTVFFWFQGEKDPRKSNEACGHSGQRQSDIEPTCSL